VHPEKPVFLAGLPWTTNQGRYRRRKMRTWIDGTKLAERWNVAGVSILSAVEDGLTAYECLNANVQAISVENFRHAFIRYSGFSVDELLKTVLFDLDEVAAYENKKNDGTCPLSAKERRHFGLLKAERDTFPAAIRASMGALLHCQKHSPIIKSDFLNFIDEKHSGLPQTLIDEIWKSIPRKFKKGPGAPRKDVKK
jgi:hypothetical protein